MRFGKTLTLLLLAMGVVLALSAWAQQKPLTRDQVQGLVRDGLADESGAKLIEQRGIGFAPAEDFLQKLRAAGANAAFLKALRAAKPPEPASAKKPLNQVQVSNMVRDGLADESGAKLIEQRGIDFTLAEDFLQKLRAAGANAAFLKALRAAKPPDAAGAKKPLNQVQVLVLLAAQVPSRRVAMLVKERGVDFEPQQDYLDKVRLGGAGEELITALKTAKVTKPATVDQAAQARQAVVREHVARGAELTKKRKYAEAEQEYRAALLLDSQDADLYVSLGYVLSLQNKWDDATSAGREALRFDPNNGGAHNNLGVALEKKRDSQGALEQYREAYTLDPKNATYKQNYERLLGRMNR